MKLLVGMLWIVTKPAPCILKETGDRTVDRRLSNRRHGCNQTADTVVIKPERE